ncbi:hypothetical protein J5751_04330 [bacterium]|nr:hypothetical protein [bacterium]
MLTTVVNAHTTKPAATHNGHHADQVAAYIAIKAAASINTEDIQTHN